MSATLWNLQHQENCHLCRLEQILLLSSLSNMRLVFEAKIFSAPFTFERSYLTEMRNYEHRAIFCWQIGEKMWFFYSWEVVKRFLNLPGCWFYFLTRCCSDWISVAANRRRSWCSSEPSTVKIWPQTVDGQDLGTNCWQSWSSRKPSTVILYRMPTTVLSQQQQLLAGNFDQLVTMDRVRLLLVWIIGTNPPEKPP